MGRCRQLMAGWGWMSRLAGDAGCQLEAQMGLPSCGFLCWALGSREGGLREGGLREGGLLAKSKVAKGARWKRPFKTYPWKLQSRGWLEPLETCSASRRGDGYRPLGRRSVKDFWSHVLKITTLRDFLDCPVVRLCVPNAGGMGLSLFWELDPACYN